MTKKMYNEFRHPNPKKNRPMSHKQLLNYINEVFKLYHHIDDIVIH